MRIDLNIVLGHLEEESTFRRSVLG